MKFLSNLFRWRPNPSPEPQAHSREEPKTPLPRAEIKKPGWMNRLSGSTILYFLVLAAIVVLLAMFSISVFWGHIDAQGLKYGAFSKMAVFAVEGTILYLVFRHVFDAFKSVRFYSLFAGLALSLIVLAHNGAMLTHDVAVNQNERLISQLGDEYKKLNDSALGNLTTSANEEARSMRDRRQWQSGRSAIQGAQNQASRAIESAQRNLKEAALEGDSRAKNSTFLPAWYFQGLAYIVVFASAVFALVGLGLMNEKAMEDFENRVGAYPQHYPAHAPYTVSQPTQGQTRSYAPSGNGAPTSGPNYRP
jgi:hypothetical protein